MERLLYLVSPKIV